MIIAEAVRNEDIKWDIPSLKIGYTRLIAGMVMHVIVSGEIANGLKIMKYAANHWWKFSNPRLAWLAGFLQCVALFLIAIINYLVVTISDNVLDVAKDFTALLIIADFDDILSTMIDVYASQSEPSFEAREYSDMLQVDTTTSRDAAGNSNCKLDKDPVLEMINRRRSLAKEAIKSMTPEGVTNLDSQTFGDTTWGEIKDNTWPERGISELHTYLKFPVYTEEEWYLGLSKMDQERVTDLVAAERIIQNQAPLNLIYRPQSMYIKKFGHRPLYADLEYFIY